MRGERGDGGGLGLDEHAARIMPRDEEGVEEHPPVVREEGRVLRLTALLEGGHVARHEPLQQLARVAALQGEHAAPGQHGVPRLVQQVPLHARSFASSTLRRTCTARVNDGPRCVRKQVSSTHIVTQVHDCCQLVLSQKCVP